MAKYYKFHYSAGYVGTDEENIVKFSDDVTEQEVSDTFDDWYEDKRSDYGNVEEISKEQAENEGIDEDYTN